MKQHSLIIPINITSKEKLTLMTQIASAILASRPEIGSESSKGLRADYAKSLASRSAEILSALIDHIELE